MASIYDIENEQRDEGNKAKRVIGTGGVLATEETLKEVRDALGGGTTWFYVQKETGATYKYYGYASSTGWKIMRKTLATGVFSYAQDTAEDFATGWANRATHTYTNAL
jgi:hypothetical protein